MIFSKVSYRYMLEEYDKFEQVNVMEVGDRREIESV